MSKLSDTEYELLNSNLNAAITINKLRQELETTKKLLDEAVGFYDNPNAPEFSIWERETRKFLAKLSKDSPSNN